MTALANSLKRIWSAKNRVPHLTGWGTLGSTHDSNLNTRRTDERFRTLKELIQRNLPNVIAVACSLFR
jgi:hypothetical protein